jgi:hypothetical protein
MMILTRARLRQRGIINIRRFDRGWSYRLLRASDVVRSRVEEVVVEEGEEEEEEEEVSATLSYLDYRYMSKTLVPWRLCLAGR